MQEDNKIEKAPVSEFLLLGGPLHRLGQRVGLVRNGTNTLRLGIALGLLTWGILALLTVFLGKSQTVFSLSVIGAHARLLIAIPLLFLCETLVAPRMADFVRNIVRADRVLEDDLPVLEAVIRRIGRLKDSWLAEGIFILIAFVFPLVEDIIGTPGSTGNWATVIAVGGGEVKLILGWYLVFCLPLFRFLLLRWIWYMLLWWYFLWQVKKLKLNLMPTHPDGVGGLGYLEVVQEHFIPMILAISVVYSASFAEELVAQIIVFESLYLYFLILLFLVAILFIGPLFMFSHKIWVCRSNGLSKYMAMASRYVNAFDRKWIQNKKVSGEDLLGTPDMQSLADLTNSVNVVRGMRSIPVSRRLVIEFTVSLFIPLLPLLFFKYHINQFATQLFQILVAP